MKRLASAFLCVLLFVTLFPANIASAADGTLANFEKERTYTSGQFADVPVSSTFAPNVEASYEMGIMQGQSDASFGVGKKISRLAALMIACRLHSIYYSGQDNIEADAANSSKQAAYLTYAEQNGLYSSFTDWTSPARRCEFALILNSAFPDSALEKINSVEDNAIPDVPASASYAAAVYRLYRAGVMTGNDASGTFQPQSYISRGAACAIATRMADPDLRQTITLTASSASKALSAEEVYAKCSPAVAYIEVCDSSGNASASGSGFFIDSSGTFVTCYHVIDGCSSAKVQTTDGKTYAVSGVYDSSKADDWAVLKVNGSGFQTLTAGAADQVAGGETVFAIGSPLGLSDSISQGIVSNTNRSVDGKSYIQTTASISSGSSGGALINEFGRVIGITSASYVDGQNLNLAIPISMITGFSKGAVTPLSALAQSAGSGTTDSQGQGRHSDIYNYLCWIVNTYADTTINGNPAAEYNYGDNETVDVMYDIQSRCIAFINYFTFDDGSDALTFLVVSQSLEPYQFIYLDYPDSQTTEESASGSGYMSPYDFTSDTTLSFDSYTGSGKEGDAIICTLLTESTVNFIDWLLSSHFTDGYSIYDLGFYALYAKWH